MGRSAFNPRNQRIRTGVPGLNVVQGFISRVNVPAAVAVAAAGAGVLALTNLTDAEHEITAGIVSPATPRALSIAGNVSGISGNVAISGTNYLDAEITETIALNGTSTVHGSKAFKRITSITLPAQTHIPTAQVETAEVTHAAGAGGTLVVRITAAGVAGSPVDVNVAVENGDIVETVAQKVRLALGANAAITAVYDIGGTGANIVLTALAPAANDSTLAIALQNADSTSVTFGASGNTTAGVPYDKVSAGWGDKLGIPFKLSFNSVLAAFLGGTKEATAPTVTVDDDEIEKNTIDLNSALNSADVDYYLIRE
jgi:hypothetical protein